MEKSPVLPKKLLTKRGHCGIIYNVKIVRQMPQRSIRRIAMIIAAVGKNASGKDYFLEYISKEFGIPMLSIGDVARALPRRRGLRKRARTFTIFPKNICRSTVRISSRSS